MRYHGLRRPHLGNLAQCEPADIIEGDPSHEPSNHNLCAYAACFGEGSLDEGGWAKCIVKAAKVAQSTVWLPAQRRAVDYCTKWYNNYTYIMS